MACVHVVWGLVGCGMVLMSIHCVLREFSTASVGVWKGCVVCGGCVSTLLGSGSSAGVVGSGGMSCCAAWFFVLCGLVCVLVENCIVDASILLVFCCWFVW